MLIIVLEKLHFDKRCRQVKAPTTPILYSTMSASNITPAARSSLDKYKDKYQKLKDAHAAKVRENNSLKEELLKYQNEVRTLRRGFGENGIYCGRNTTSRWRKKGEWDQTDLSIMTLSNHFARANSCPITSALDQKPAA